MDRSWDSAFLVANLQTGKNECSFYKADQMHPWRSGRNDYLGAKEKFLELYRQAAYSLYVSSSKSTTTSARSW